MDSAVFKSGAFGFMPTNRTPNSANVAALLSYAHTRVQSGVAVLDLCGTLIQVNQNFARLFGYEIEELLIAECALFNSGGAEFLEPGLLEALLERPERDFTCTRLCCRKDGTKFWTLLTFSVIFSGTGNPGYLVASLHGEGAPYGSGQGNQIDGASAMSDIPSAESRLKAESDQEALRTITNNLPVLIAKVDKDLCYRFNNELYRDVYGVDPATLLGKHISTVLPPAAYAEMRPYFAKVLAGERVTYDTNSAIDNPENTWNATLVPEWQGDNVIGFYMMAQNVTEQKRVERALHDMAMLDPLTALPNRNALLKNLGFAISDLRDQYRSFAVFFLDLDRFKEVNDTHGHQAGDLLLKQVASRIESAVSTDDFVGRLSGDEFVVISRGIRSVDMCSEIARQIGAVLSTPFELGAATVRVGSSIGVALHESALGVTVETVLERADSAMYEAKRRGRNGYWVVSD
jgi:diguanylate cyclase (GGDEF)-like protein/PAS domain S-box-containing protein